MEKVMIELKSVSTGIALDGMCYPMLANGGYDYEAGSHISETPENTEWMESLSEKDRKTFDTLLRMAN